MTIHLIVLRTRSIILSGSRFRIFFKKLLLILGLTQFDLLCCSCISFGNFSSGVLHPGSCILSSYSLLISRVFNTMRLSFISMLFTLRIPFAYTAVSQETYDYLTEMSLFASISYCRDLSFPFNCPLCPELPNSMTLIQVLPIPKPVLTPQEIHHKWIGRNKRILGR